MDQREICCCGASRWTRVIAWFQIIGSVLLIIGMSWQIGESSSNLAVNVGAEASKTSLNITFAVEEVQAGRVLFAYVGITCSSILLIFSILSFTMAFILLRGSLSKNLRQIYAWIVFTDIFLAFWVVLHVLYCFFAPTGLLLVLALFQLILLLVIDGFCLWVVTIHMKEMEASARPVILP